MTRRMTGPLSVEGAEAYVASTCFKTGPPGKVGVELELVVLDADEPARAVAPARLKAALAGIGPLPAGGLLTNEPGGQLELSSQPAPSLADCVAAVAADLARLRDAASAAGLLLVGVGADPYRSPCRVLDSPRYAAMETFFDRSSPDGRVMMCSTASVQVCLDAGLAGDGPHSYRRRWRLLHALGPVLVAAFANSPLLGGRPTGWRSTRQAVWTRLDPGRTTAPDGWASRLDRGPEPSTAWARYALDASVLCVRRDDPGPWTVPAGLSFRDWLHGGGPRPPTREDLDYHLTTLFPPVRPRGWLEVRMIDAQPADDWVVPTAVVTSLLDDLTAADAALAALERVDGRAGGHRRDGRWPDLWTRAARDALGDPDLRAAALGCFTAALAALDRIRVPAATKAAVERYLDRYVARGRCPADDRLDEWRGARGSSTPTEQEAAWC